MIVELEIPDWCDAENIYLLTRSELVAFKMAGDGWKVKKTRCNKCGHCCMVHPQNGAYFELKNDGSCVNLVKDGDFFVCKLGMEKPLACVLGEPNGSEYKQFNCSIEY